MRKAQTSTGMLMFALSDMGYNAFADCTTAWPRRPGAKVICREWSPAAGRN